MNARYVKTGAERPWKRVALIVGPLFVLSIAGCAGVAHSPLATPLPTASPAAPHTAPVPAATKSAPASSPAAKAPQPPASTARAAPKDTNPPQVAKQNPAPLDLASLETRLKETKAIGALTKIALKNQVDDLLDEFRAFYQGKLKTNLVDLRRSYDLLVLKVLALLQDSDPPLASAIAASREAMWGILSDRAKFAAI